jgi:hypothetical protein
LELVGQPTWLTINTISVKVVLRGGLKIGMDITLPQTLVGFSGAEAVLPLDAAGTDQRTHVSLPGTYKIMKLLHIGDFRNPDGASWSTNIEAMGAASVSGADPTVGFPSGTVERGPDLPDLSVPLFPQAKPQRTRRV